ncbi:MAG: hypothetical protein IJ682_00395 [Lachnospiraceae bacterium]|nr:hypothetical protein [Lachnospiraceae bacterium]
MDRILCLLIYLITILSRFSKTLARCGIGSYEEWSPEKPYRLLLVGYNGARNTGSDVRVAAIARQLKQLFGAEHIQITVMTLDAKSLSGYFDEDVTLLPFSSIFPWDLYRACCRHHAAILCEGSTLKSTFANALTLFMCEAASVMAGQKKPCIAYGSEVGQMEPFLEQAAARLCRDTYFITRTKASLFALQKLGLKGHTGTDAAWLYDRAIPAEDADRLLRQQGWDGKQPLLGIAVINPFCWPVRASLFKWLKGISANRLSGQYDKWYFFSDSPARRRAYRRYLHETARAVRSFLQKHDCFPVLIGMERLDEKACRALLGQLAHPVALFLSGDCTADVMTGVLHRLSILVTSRYHAAVLSMEHPCPIVAVSMDERLDGIMDELSLNQNYLFHVTDRRLGKKLYRALSVAYSDADAISRHLRREHARYQEKQDDIGHFLKQYIQEGC